GRSRTRATRSNSAHFFPACLVRARHSPKSPAARAVGVFARCSEFSQQNSVNQKSCTIITKEIATIPHLLPNVVAFLLECGLLKPSLIRPAMLHVQTPMWAQTISERVGRPLRFA